MYDAIELDYFVGEELNEMKRLRLLEVRVEEVKLTLIRRIEVITEEEA